MEWPQVYAWIILPGLIFLARAADVSLGTLRVVFVARGARRLAPLFGFFEVLIWILVIGQIVQNLDNAVCYIDWGGRAPAWESRSIASDWKPSPPM
jgi:uncharacterized protein YebE (UPF0316 family)